MDGVARVHAARGRGGLIPTTQLLVFRFARGASFEGELIGALDRIEADLAVRIVDVLFVRRDDETGEMQAFSRQAETAAGPGGAIEFRLDPAARRRSSERAFEATPGLEQLARMLEPGGAVAAVLVEHRWAAPLVDAAGRAGGEAALVEFVEAERLADLLPQLFRPLNPSAT
jgi:hypothetical protein